MLMIVDGNNMAYRALHTMSLSHGGADTSITYGTLLMLSSLIRKQRPKSVLFCYDGGTPQFRKDTLPAYKANRKHNSDSVDWDDIYRQMDQLCFLALPLHGVMTMRADDMEADDLMAQGAYLAEDQVLLVSSDDDLLQCVDEDVAVYNPSRDITYTVHNLYSETGVPQYFHLLYKMLLGDSSDNVPGVSYIGEKTAKKVIEWICDNLDEERDPYEYATLCGVITELPLNSRQRESLVSVGPELWDAMYKVMDLMFDYVGAREIIWNTDWMPANTEQIRQYYVKQGFMSLLEERADRLYESLERPLFRKGEL